MAQDPLDDFSQAQRDRLAFMELRLRFIGELRRQDLITRFDMGPAAASRDMALYKELAPGNIDYDPQAKSYVLGGHFKSLFAFTAPRVLSWFVSGFGDVEPLKHNPLIVCDVPSPMNSPDLSTLAAITRAIHQKCPLKIEYHSISSGKSQREIIPFALIDNGLRWHVRAFDRKSGEFRDFVITRILRPQLQNSAVEPHERCDQDIQWTRIVELELVPHPDQPHPEITRMDFGMVEGELKLKLRAATAGYVLRRWSIDCSPDHSLRGPDFRLWLKDSLALYGVKNARFAPGYTQSAAK